MRIASVATAALASIVTLCTGCSGVDGGTVPGQTIDGSRGVYVGLIDDAENTADQTHIGSGTAATDEFREQLAMRGVRISTYPAPGDYSLEARYTRWEDHATQWTGVPDVVELSVKLQDGLGGQPVAVVRTTAFSSTITLSNDSPKVLIPQAVRQALDKMYGRRGK